MSSRKAKKEILANAKKRKINPYLLGMILGTVIFGGLAYYAYDLTKDGKPELVKDDDLSTIDGLLLRGNSEQILERLESISIGRKTDALPFQVDRLEQRRKIAKHLFGKELAPLQHRKVVLNYLRASVSLLALKHENGFDVAHLFDELSEITDEALIGEDPKLAEEASVSLLIGSIFQDSVRHRNDGSIQTFESVKQLDQLFLKYRDNLEIARQLISLIQLFDKWTIHKEVEVPVLERIFLHYNDIEKFQSLASAVNHRRIRIQYDLYIMEISVGLEANHEILTSAKLAIKDPHFSDVEVQHLIDIGYRFERVDHYDSANEIYELVHQFLASKSGSQNSKLLQMAQKGKQRYRLLNERIDCSDLIRSEEISKELLSKKYLVLVFLDHEKQKELAQTIQVLKNNRRNDNIGLIAFSAESPLNSYWPRLVDNLSHPSQLVDDFDGVVQERLFIDKTPYILLLEDLKVVDLHVTNSALGNIH